MFSTIYGFSLTPCSYIANATTLCSCKVLKTYYHLSRKFKITIITGKILHIHY